jgi:NAD+ kinase
VVAVAFVVHPGRPEAAALAERASQWLSERGHTIETIVADVDHTHEEAERPVVAAPRDASGRLRRAHIDLAVSLGGDGTMLRTVAATIDHGVPVLGVNLGHLGYLTEVDPEGLEAALERFISGDYRIEERMTLAVQLERRGDDQPPSAGQFPHTVVNEAVVEKTVPGHTIRITASVAGKPLVTYAADGVLVATPTGSTAYNLSLRGPIVSPRLNAVVITPISPHMLFDRSLVLAPEEWLRLELAVPRQAQLVLDGRSVTTMEPGDALVCRAGDTPARLVSFGGREFHTIVRARFNLADR